LLAAQRLESLGRISSEITHDLNNLLVTILGNAELVMLDLPRDSGTRVYLEEIEVAAQSAAHLTRQLGSYAGRSNFDYEIAHVSRLVSDMTRSLRNSVNSSPTVVYEPGGQLQRGAWIYADIHKMREAILNVLVNAAESLHGPEGIVTVRTGLEWTSHTSLRTGYNADDLPEGHYVVIEISDDGSGIDAATIRRIFDPSYSTKHADRGLGLADALGIIRSHRGTIRVSSGSDRGTTVRILLPCASAMRPQLLKTRGAQPHLPEFGAIDESRCSNAASKRMDERDAILIVDRKPDEGRLTGTSLLSAGYRVCTASSRRRALALLRRRICEIRAVVLDLSLAEIARSGTFAAIRSIDPELPVIFCSSQDEGAFADLLSELDHVAVAHKPFEAGEFTRKLREASGETAAGIQDAG
jgi:two-component system cell cycle sensor histidine kinase/response regulator CckA